jgi:hypothetical protein
MVLWFIKKIKPVEIVSGECKVGADAFAKKFAKDCKIPYQPYPPRFPEERREMSYEEIRDVYYDRNFEIAFYCNVLLALEAPTKDGGTANTIKHWRNLQQPEKYLILA